MDKGVDSFCKYLMRITGRNVLNKFAQKHPNDRSALNRWYNLMHQGTFNSFADLCKIFPYANQVKVRKRRFNQPPKDEIWTVFNIGGNNVRLIASIQYAASEQKVTINKILTHAEYDKGRWKE